MVSLTLNQDKRRRFDSYPGSITAGQATLVRLTQPGQDGYFTLRCSL